MRKAIPLANTPNAETSADQAPVIANARPNSAAGVGDLPPASGLLPLLLGLDVGTTSCKGGVFDSRGRLLALAAASYTIDRPRPGYAEQDPEQYWDAAVQCVRELLAAPGVDARRLAALASCGQAPTLVLLDGSGAPLRRAILWQDTRAVAEAEALARDPGADVLAEWMGLGWPVDASLPLARLRWLRHHEPHVLARVALTLQPKDFVHLRLTGRAASDTWSAKGLVHQATRRPIAALRDAAGLDREIVPDALLSHEIVGGITPAGAAASGLPAGLPVVAGWTDAMAAMLGTGAFGRPGLAGDVSGTSEVVGLCAAARPADPHPLFAAPVLDSGRYAVYGPTQASGGSLGWALRTLAAEPLAVDAALGAGLSPDVTAASDAMVHLQPPLLPDPAHRAAYARLFDRYAALYPCLRDLLGP